MRSHSMRLHLPLCASFLALAACNPPGSQDPIGQLSQANFVNGNFETATLGSWTATRAQWGTGAGTVGFANFPPRTLTDLNLTTGAGTQLSGTVGVGVPADLTAADSLRLPFFGANAAKVNGRIGTQGAHNSNYLQQTMTVTVADVDPNDGIVHLRFAAAPILNAPTHTPLQQPYFFIELRNTTKGVALYNTFNFSNQPGVQWKPAAVNINAEPDLYTDWEAFDIAPGPAGIEVGDSVIATVVGTGCAFNGHFGEVYVDEFGTTFPYPNVNVSAPQFVNANSDLVYTITAKNSTLATTTGVIVDFSMPPVADSNVTQAPAVVPTTFQSVTAVGASCTTPAVGAIGTVVCNIGNLAPGGTYTFQVTVHVPVIPGAHVAPDFVNEGTYDIRTDQRPAPLGGGLVQTQVSTSTVVGLDTTLTDGKSSVTWGSANSYTLTITNHGPSDATNVGIADVRPATLTAATWTCTASGGATCGSAMGSGNIATTGNNIPVNGTLTYTINATVTGGPADGSITYRATATPAVGQVQSTLFDNTGVDTDTASTTLSTLTVNSDASGTGSGTIVSYPAGINCGATCSASYAHGTQVALSALPAVGSVFTGWTAGCAGTTNPCTITINANTTVTAKFDKPILTTALVTTSNGGLTTVRPGDTATYSVKMTIPAGATGVPVKATDAFPTDMDFASATATTLTGAGALTCSPNACTAPTIVTGATTTWDYGTVSCSAAGPCEINFTVTGRVAPTATRGETLSNAISATLMGTQNPSPLTVVEPNLTITRAPSPAMGLVRGQPETITVTVANNTGGANAPAFDVAMSFPTPTGYTAGNYVNGTCPAAVASFAGNAATFTFPTGAGGAIAAGSSCTFTYQLTGNANATGNATVDSVAGTGSAKSITGASPPAKTYAIVPPAVGFMTAAIANSLPCAALSECVSMLCFGDNKCGIPDAQGPCTIATGAVVCRSGQCSHNGTCSPAGACFVDDDCTTTIEFCNTQTTMCTPKIPNGLPLPMITGHMPDLTSGTCSTAVGVAVCASGVCDTTDNKCGLGDEHGPCTMATACRSGFCSASGACAPVGGCLVDGDCDTTAQFCNTETKACVAKIPNGGKVPSIMGHTPALGGTCSVAVSQMVCVSMVCDLADDLCGYANGDGSCDNGTAAAVCRSGACGNDGKCGLVDGEGPCDAASIATCRANACRPSGVCGTGCKTDNDCSANAPLCNSTSGDCFPKAPNGSPVPTLLGHDPTLDGTCTATSGAIACISGVCDPLDNLCGLADGNTGSTTTCTAATAATMCRSGRCGSDGKCGTPSTLVLTGGGLSCSYGARSPLGDATWLALLAVAGLLLRRRRRVA